MKSNLGAVTSVTYPCSVGGVIPAEIGYKRHIAVYRSADLAVLHHVSWKITESRVQIHLIGFLAHVQRVLY